MRPLWGLASALYDPISYIIPPKPKLEMLMFYNFHRLC